MLVIGAGGSAVSIRGSTVHKAPEEFYIGFRMSTVTQGMNVLLPEYMSL